MNRVALGGQSYQNGLAAEAVAAFQEKRKPDWRKFRAGQGPAPE